MFPSWCICVNDMGWFYWLGIWMISYCLQFPISMNSVKILDELEKVLAEKINSSWKLYIPTLLFIFVRSFFKGGLYFDQSSSLIVEILLTDFCLFPGTYIDKKCPFTGDVSIRGRILAGTCHSAKMVRTIIVRRNYLHYVKKYQRWKLVVLSKLFVLFSLFYVNISDLYLIRYEKRHSNIPAHISPCFRVKEGDHVIIGQCRSVQTFFDYLYISGVDLSVIQYTHYCSVSQAIVKDCEI